MADPRKARAAEPRTDDAVAPVALPDRPAAPAEPAHEIAGTEPPRGRPDSDDADSEG